MKIIRKCNTITKEWSGGTTTELAIWPPGAVYADRDFIWRLSSAAVLDEESTFTSLPGYYRLLSVREGCIKLSHDGGEWYDLTVGGVAAFDGASVTKSVGKVTDFNLMTRKGKASGALAPRIIEECSVGKAFRIRDILPADGDEQGSVLYAVFVSSGGPAVVEGGCSVSLAPGELVFLDRAEAEGASFSVKEKSLLIGIRIVSGHSDEPGLQ